MLTPRDLPRGESRICVTEHMVAPQSVNLADPSPVFKSMACSPPCSLYFAALRPWN